jgi:hypothetical protein
MVTPTDFRVFVIRQALDIYVKTGMQVNSAYTLKNMLNVAEEITGKKYAKSKKAALVAIDDLTAIWAEIKNKEKA